MGLAAVKNEGQSFVRKFGNDWCTNLAGFMAYNFLGAIFPLLIGILLLADMFLPLGVVHSIGDQLNGALPAGAGQPGALNINFNDVLDSFRSEGALALIISFATLLWTGTTLFGCMENAFSIIYRTKDRNFFWQRLMGVVMICIFAVLAPLSFAAGSIAGSYERITRGFADSLPFIGAVFAGGGYIIGVAVAFLLFLAIYVVVPNIKLSFDHAWRGALTASILYVASTLIFPLYTAHAMQGNKFGSSIALLGIVTFWFWIISLILLLGAEVNSYFALGQRATADDLPGIIHGLKVHREARAGEDEASPSAQGRIMEDVQPKADRERQSQTPSEAEGRQRPAIAPQESTGRG